MARVVVELYNGKTPVWENATYRKLGDSFAIVRNGKVCVRIASIFVYGITVDPGGYISSADNPRTGTASV